MLDEIIDNVGIENIVKELKENDIKGLMFRIPLDRAFDKDRDYIDNTAPNNENINPTNQALYDWFKERKFYCDYISSNKAVISERKYMFPKATQSNQANAIILNTSTIKKKNEDKNYGFSNFEMLKTTVKEQCSACTEDDKFKYYEKALNQVSEIVDDKNVKVIIILDVKLEEIKERCNEYLGRKLFNNIVTKEFGIFATSNSKKPHLIPKTNKLNNSAFSCNEDKAIELNYLNKYLQTKPEKTTTSIGGNITYELTIDNKSKVIDKYDQIPYKSKDIFEKRNLFIKDYVIDNNEKFYNKINKLTEFNKHFIKLYEKFYLNLNNHSVSRFINNYDKIINHMYNLVFININDSNKEPDQINMINNMIDFNIATYDYFFEKTLKGDIESMNNIISNKVINLKENKQYNIENDNEFSEILGYLASYVMDKSTSARASIKLKNECKYVKDINKFMYILDNKVDKYANKLYGIRFNYIYSAVKGYIRDNDKIEFNKIFFDSGLYDFNNIFYIKNNKEVEGEDCNE